MERRLTTINQHFRMLGGQAAIITHATLNGRLLAQTAVTLNQATVTQP